MVLLATPRSPVSVLPQSDLEIRSVRVSLTERRFVMNKQRRHFAGTGVLHKLDVDWLARIAALLL
jgi:hypothetical protein